MKLALRTFRFWVFLAGILGAFNGFAQIPTFNWASGLLTDAVNSSDFCSPRKMAVDQAGNVYITGSFQGIVDFDPGAGTSNLSSDGAEDIFVCKLDARGAFVWARSIGGTGTDGGEGIALDGSGNVYLTGYFSGTVSFDPGNNSADLRSSGQIDIFICKLDANGTSVWARSIGGTKADHGSDIAVDGSGNLFMTGSFRDVVDFDPGSGVASLTSIDLDDIFVSKLDSSGAYLWAKSLGGTGLEIGLAIAVDVHGNVLTTGFFDGDVDFDPGSGTARLVNSTGLYDAFVSKLDTYGNYVWAKKISGPSYEVGTAIAVDANGNVYTTGGYQGTVDFDPGSATASLSSAGNGDIFVSKLDSNGAYIWARSMGSADNDEGEGIDVDGSGNVYITGSFMDVADFDPGIGSVQLTAAAYQDAFVTKLDENGAFAWARSIGGSRADVGSDVFADGSGSVYTLGAFQSSVDFDPGMGSANINSGNVAAGFVTKWSQSGVGITSQELEKLNVAVRPNPTNNAVVVELSEVRAGASILITDMTGKLITSKTIAKGGAPFVRFDLGSLTAGVYLLSVKDGSASFQTKIVVN